MCLPFFVRVSTLLYLTVNRCALWPTNGTLVGDATHRYRPAARTKSDIDSGTSNQGFRCAADDNAPKAEEEETHLQVQIQHEEGGGGGGGEDDDDDDDVRTEL